MDKKIGTVTPQSPNTPVKNSSGDVDLIIGQWLKKNPGLKLDNLSDKQKADLIAYVFSQWLSRSGISPSNLTVENLKDFAKFLKGSDLLGAQADSLASKIESFVKKVETATKTGDDRAEESFRELLFEVKGLISSGISFPALVEFKDNLEASLTKFNDLKGDFTDTTAGKNLKDQALSVLRSEVAGYKLDLLPADGPGVESQKKLINSERALQVALGLVDDAYLGTLIHTPVKATTVKDYLGTLENELLITKKLLQKAVAENDDVKIKYYESKVLILSAAIDKLKTMSPTADPAGIAKNVIDKLLDTAQAANKLLIVKAKVDKDPELVRKLETQQDIIAKMKEQIQKLYDDYFKKMGNAFSQISSAA